jgi:hypothetical protein
MSDRGIDIEVSKKPLSMYYAQSANTLFNFMEQCDYLKQALEQKALIPRYYVEKIGYLDLEVKGEKYDEIEILQTCFCDIPLSKLFKKGSIECIGETFDKLSDNDKKKASSKNTHPDFYGRFAIAFSKEWGSKKGLQPIHYINEKSQIIKKIKDEFADLYAIDDLPKGLEEGFINRLAYIKPVSGAMEKYFYDENNEKLSIIFNKTFHDEQEWRYVPDADVMGRYGLYNIHANPQAIKERESWNKQIRNERFKELWLNFEFSDIRYLIVPDDGGRNELINIISNLQTTLFGDNEDLERKILISKIIVLDTLKGDM